MMTRRALIAMAASAAFSAERKNRAPISHDPLRVRMPEASPTKLPNGLTLLAMEDDRVPLAWVRINVDGAGIVYQNRPGIAQATAEMLSQGTNTRSAKQLAVESSRLGATLSSGIIANIEAATVNASGLSSHFADWLALAADTLINPVFPGDEFNSLRQRKLVNARMHAANPDAVAQFRLARLLYGTHPAGQGDTSAADLAALTLEILAAWHRERYAPANTLVSVIGRVPLSSIASIVEKLFGGWKTAEPKFELPPEPQPPPKRHIVLVDRPGAPQTDLAVGGLLFERRSPDFFPMVVLISFLGGVDFALQKAHVRNAACEYSVARYTGYWRIRAGVQTDSTDEALNGIFTQLQAACDGKILPSELDEAKASVIGRFALDLEQPSQVINYSYQRYRYGFSSDFWERYPAKIDAVTADEVRGVAQKYFQPESAQIVAVGDAAKIRGALEKLGPIEG